MASRARESRSLLVSQSATSSTQSPQVASNSLPQVPAPRWPVPMTATRRLADLVMRSSLLDETEGERSMRRRSASTNATDKTQAAFLDMHADRHLASREKTAHAAVTKPLVRRSGRGPRRNAMINASISRRSLIASGAAAAGRAAFGRAPARAQAEIRLRMFWWGAKERQER